MQPISMYVFVKGRDKTLDMATGRQRSRISKLGKINNIHFSITSRSGKGPSKPFIQWVPRGTRYLSLPLTSN
jgi:hypothetical protein